MAFKGAVLIAALQCMGLVPGVGAASPRPATRVEGNHFELLHWMDPQSPDVVDARAVRDLGMLQAVNVAFDRSERDGTRWFKAALECPGDTLPWPYHGQVIVRLQSGELVQSLEVIASGDDIRMSPYWPCHYRVPVGPLHILPPRGGWSRPVWLLVGFPTMPAFDIQQVSDVRVVAPNARAGILGGHK